jgi:hypothetical protein
VLIPDVTDRKTADWTLETAQRGEPPRKGRRSPRGGRPARRPGDPAPANAGRRIGTVAEQVDDVERLGLSVSWAKVNQPSDFWSWVGRPFGWLAIILALSLGAPFWFDVLGKFSRLRNTGNREGTQKTDPAAETATTRAASVGPSPRTRSNSCRVGVSGGRHGGADSAGRCGFGTRTATRGSPN